MFNATFNNISWRSVLLLAETGVPEENDRSIASYLTLGIHFFYQKYFLSTYL